MFSSRSRVAEFPAVDVSGQGRKSDSRRRQSWLNPRSSTSRKFVEVYGRRECDGGDIVRISTVVSSDRAAVRTRHRRRDSCRPTRGAVPPATTRTWSGVRPPGPQPLAFPRAACETPGYPPWRVRRPLHVSTTGHGRALGETAIADLRSAARAARRRRPRCQHSGKRGLFQKLHSLENLRGGTGETIRGGRDG